MMQVHWNEGPTLDFCVISVRQWYQQGQRGRSWKVLASLFQNKIRQTPMCFFTDLVPNKSSSTFLSFILGEKEKSCLYLGTSTPLISNFLPPPYTYVDCFRCIYNALYQQEHIDRYIYPSPPAGHRQPTHPPRWAPDDFPQGKVEGKQSQLTFLRSILLFGLLKRSSWRVRAKNERTDVSLPLPIDRGEEKKGPEKVRLSRLRQGEIRQCLPFGLNATSFLFEDLANSSVVWLG